MLQNTFHDDVIKWKHFPRNWPFVREIHRSPVNFPHKGQWRGALMFSLIYAWINDWVNNREAGDLRRQHGHYDVIVMDDKSTVVQVMAWCCQATNQYLIQCWPRSVSTYHYDDVIMTMLASQITSLTVVLASAAMVLTRNILVSWLV